MQYIYTSIDDPSLHSKRHVWASKHIRELYCIIFIVITHLGSVAKIAKLDCIVYKVIIAEI